METKYTKITQDDRQTRATIPSKIVEELHLTKSHLLGWTIEKSRKKLIAEIITEKEFEQIKKEEQSE